MASHRNLVPLLCVSVACILVLLPVTSRAEIFSSIHQFEKVLHSEKALATGITDFLEKEEARLQQLRDIAADYREHSLIGLNNSEQYLSNPVNAFRLIKRLTADWKATQDIITNKPAQDFVTGLTKSLGSNFPTTNDLSGAAQSLFRLQDTYSLETDELADAKVAIHFDDGTVDTIVDDGEKLTGDDCQEIGRMAYENNDLYHAVLWFNQAVERLEAENVTIPTLTKTLDYLSFSYYKLKNVHQALEITKKWFLLEPSNPRAKRNIDGYLKEIAEDDKAPAGPRVTRREMGYHASKEYQNYEALCRGETTQPNPFIHKLKCQYRRDTHPYFILRPLKEEEKFLSPFIAIYHDIITDSQIAKIKELASPRLHRSIVFSAKPTDDYRVSKRLGRVSKSSWLVAADDPVINKVLLKAAYSLGLNNVSSEDLQVLNYGLGGQYEPHMDAMPPGNLYRQKQNWLAGKDERSHFGRFDNRISTTMIWLSDVEAGGKTVYPHIGAAVEPIKGAMVNWWNLYRNGAQDMRTTHAGCPVLVGSKWVSNVWIHERDQEFRRPCSTNPLI